MSVWRINIRKVKTNHSEMKNNMIIDTYLEDTKQSYYTKILLNKSGKLFVTYRSVIHRKWAYQYQFISYPPITTNYKKTIEIKV